MALFSIFAVPPAYRLFCQVTGWGGTTQRAEIAPTVVLDRKITVRFDANTAQGLPWRFKPEQLSQTINVGASSLAFYESENLANSPVAGQATFNVSPAKAGIYFRKIDCFCFTEQTLQPGESVSMPVAYFIDPAIDMTRIWMRSRPSPFPIRSSGSMMTGSSFLRFLLILSRVRA